MAFSGKVVSELSQTCKGFETDADGVGHIVIPDTNGERHTFTAKYLGSGFLALLTDKTILGYVFPLKVKNYSFTFGSTNASETFDFGTTYSTIPGVLSGWIAGVSFINNSHIKNITATYTGLSITRDDVASYKGIGFTVLLIIF